MYPRRNNYGGRSMARNPEQGDVHGRLKARRFDLAAEAPPVRLSEHELAEIEFKALSEDQQGQLSGFLANHIQPEVPRIGGQRGGVAGCLWSDTLAGEATAALGWHVNIRAMNGALLSAGYNPVARTGRGAVWAVGAKAA